MHKLKKRYCEQVGQSELFFGRDWGKYTHILIIRLSEILCLGLVHKVIFHGGVGEGLGKIYHYLKKELQIEIYMIAKKKLPINSII